MTGTMTMKHQTNSRQATERPDPLSAVPVIAPGVDAKVAPDGGLHLRRRAALRSPIARLLNRWFGWRREHYVNLDASGACFWRQIDGERSLADIADLLKRDWKLNKSDCRTAVVKYSSALMRRGLIQLKVSAPAEGIPSESKTP